jgi:hypothetical protein
MSDMDEATADEMIFYYLLDKYRTARGKTIQDDVTDEDLRIVTIATRAAISNAEVVFKILDEGMNACYVEVKPEKGEPVADSTISFTMINPTDSMVQMIRGINEASKVRGASKI